MLYMVTFTINIPQMLAYIQYMDPMGNWHLSNLLPELYPSKHGAPLCSGFRTDPALQCQRT